MSVDRQSPQLWEDCFKILPYRDYLGRWYFFPRYTQRRIVEFDGKRRWQYREREETAEEWEGRQW